MCSRRSLIVAPAAAWLAGCATPARPEPRDWFIFLETGVPTPADRDAVMRMQRGHLDNFKRLFAAGTLSAAGPLRDPSGRKRGIVVVRAATIEQLRGYFETDDYVRRGHMTLNAVPATAVKPLATEGIDPEGIEEVRIVQIARGSADAATRERQRMLLRWHLDRGTFGAWYTLHEGPVAEVLFTRLTDTAALEPALAPFGADASVWPQWLGKGVLR
jgi:uncharacterized protein YciI